MKAQPDVELCRTEMNASRWGCGIVLEERNTDTDLRELLWVEHWVLWWWLLDVCQDE